jgi:GLPGLI family protein
MKFIYTFLVAVTISLTAIAQDGLYIKYESKVESNSEDGAMVATMMDGSTMELATSGQKNWVKTEMGSMMTMTMEVDVAEKNNMTMLMSGMMGTMAFQGDPDEFKDEAAEQAANTDTQFLNETKDILGYECKKAVMTYGEGNKAAYWYTEKIARPEGIYQMPNQVPGLCLEFETSPQEGISVKYTAVSIKENVNMSDYKVVIPEGVEVQDLKDMANMGGN